MQTFRVELGPRSHPVHVGAGLLQNVGHLALEAGIRAGRCAVISEHNVAGFYLEPFRRALQDAGFDPLEVVVAAGEQSKSLATLTTVHDRLLEAGLDRRSAIFALGGGVVGDLAGFAASTFLRGVPLVQIPTSIVGQVDSALGGKNGVNHHRGKNLIGTFYQPAMIAADIDTLATLPDREYREGFAEVIKYGVIMDAPMFDQLERDATALLQREPALLEAMVVKSLKHKAFVVERDEREGDLRAILNFGHTLGHALEASAGYGHLLHGEAVSIGMVAAARISVAKAGFPRVDAERMERLLAVMGLPTAMPAGWHSEQFAAALKLDKKRADTASIKFVLVSALGKALTRALPFDEILKLAEMR